MRKSEMRFARMDYSTKRSLESPDSQSINHLNNSYSGLTMP